MEKVNKMLCPPGTPTLDPAFQRFEDLIEGFRRDCELRKFSTAKVYAQTARRFCAWLELRGSSAGAVTKNNLKDYLRYLQEDRKIKFESYRHDFVVINSFYSYLEEEELIQANPIPAFVKRYVTKYKNESDSEQRQLISVEQAADLVAATMEIEHQAIILLFLKTGMRRGEMATLDIADMDLEKGRLTLKKTAKRSNRLLFFDDETTAVLRKWLDARSRRKGHEGPGLFLSNQGERMSKNQLQRVVTKHATVAGLHDPESEKLADKFGPHCCRHWFTTHLRRAGMPREFIQELRGDVRKEAIDIYDHIDREELRRSYIAHIPQLGI